MKKALIIDFSRFSSLSSTMRLPLIIFCSVTFSFKHEMEIEPSLYVQANWSLLKNFSLKKQQKYFKNS